MRSSAHSSISSVSEVDSGSQNLHPNSSCKLGGGDRISSFASDTKYTLLSSCAVEQLDGLDLDLDLGEWSKGCCYSDIRRLERLSYCELRHTKNLTSQFPTSFSLMCIPSIYLIGEERWMERWTDVMMQ